MRLLQEEKKEETNEINTFAIKMYIMPIIRNEKIIKYCENENT